VSGTGMVTALAAGDADLRATYSGATGSAHITVVAPAAAPGPGPAPSSGFTLTGRVTEEGTNTSLADVRVEVKDHNNATTTSGTGNYTLSGISAGNYTLRGTKPGYDIAEPTVSISGSRTLDFTMRRVSTPSPTPTPTPTPSPGPNGPMCAASSIPSNASCINNGTPPVTAVCNDNAYSCSANRSGTCSTHGGVKCWVCPGALCNGLLPLGDAPLNYTRVPLPALPPDSKGR
jgi:hypothetical protein